jgi:hypothetical protein
MKARKKDSNEYTTSMRFIFTDKNENEKINLKMMLYWFSAIVRKWHVFGLAKNKN